MQITKSKIARRCISAMAMGAALVATAAPGAQAAEQQACKQHVYGNTQQLQVTPCIVWSGTSSRRVLFYVKNIGSTPIDSIGANLYFVDVGSGEEHTGYACGIFFVQPGQTQSCHTRYLGFPGGPRTFFARAKGTFGPLAAPNNTVFMADSPTLTVTNGVSCPADATTCL